MDGWGGVGWVVIPKIHLNIFIFIFTKTIKPVYMSISTTNSSPTYSFIQLCLTSMVGGRFLPLWSFVCCKPISFYCSSCIKTVRDYFSFLDHSVWQWITTSIIYHKSCHHCWWYQWQWSSVWSVFLSCCHTWITASRLFGCSGWY